MGFLRGFWFVLHSAGLDQNQMRFFKLMWTADNQGVLGAALHTEKANRVAIGSRPSVYCSRVSYSSVFRFCCSKAERALGSPTNPPCADKKIFLKDGVIFFTLVTEMLPSARLLL